MSSRGRRWLWASGGGALAAVALELFARFGVGLGQPVLAELDAEIEYMLVPSRTYRRFGRHIQINQHRMRAREFEAERAPGQYRVMLIGDSVIYGNHFLDQSEIVPTLVEDLLRASISCEVVVGAIATSSWGPVNQLAFVRRFGLFDADVVAIVVSSHDLTDTPDHEPDLVPYHLRSPRLALEDAWDHLYARATRRAAPARPTWEERRERSLGALSALFEEARASGARAVAFFHPTAEELTHPRASAPAVATLRRAAEAHQVPLHDLGPHYRRPGGSLYRDAIHPNPAGALRIAQALANDVARNFRGCTLRRRDPTK